MQYILLGSAIILEIIATTLLKASEGFTKLLPAAGCIILYILKGTSPHRSGCCLCHMVRRRHRRHNDHLRRRIRSESQHRRDHRDRPDHHRMCDPEPVRHVRSLMCRPLLFTTFSRVSSISVSISVTCSKFDIILSYPWLLRLLRNTYTLSFLFLSSSNVLRKENNEQ